MLLFSTYKVIAFQIRIRWEDNLKNLQKTINDEIMMFAQIRKGIMELFGRGKKRNIPFLNFHPFLTGLLNFC